MKWLFVGFQCAVGIVLLYFGFDILFDHGVIKFSDRLPFVLAEFFLAGVLFAYAWDSAHKL